MTDERVARFEELFSLTGQQILAYLVRRVSPPQDAADLMAEVFVTAWRRIDKVPDGAEGRLWLFGVARNLLANHRRGRLRHDRLADRLRDHLAERARPADLGLAVEDAAERVRAGLDRLSPEDRELLTLTAWEGLTPAEIAVVLGISPATARTRLSRARQRLRTALEAPSPERDHAACGRSPSVR